MAVAATSIKPEVGSRLEAESEVRSVAVRGWPEDGSRSEARSIAERGLASVSSVGSETVEKLR